MSQITVEETIIKKALTVAVSQTINTAIEVVNTRAKGFDSKRLARDSTELVEGLMDAIKKVANE